MPHGVTTNNDDADKEIRSWWLLEVNILHFRITSVKKNRMKILQGIKQHNSKSQCNNISKIPLNFDVCSYLKMINITLCIKMKL